MKKCPHCGSDKTITKRMAYEHYTTLTTSEGRNAGLTLSAVAAPTLALGDSSGWSLAQTRFAARCAPPSNPYPARHLWRGYWWLIGIFGFLILCSGVWFEQSARGTFWMGAFALIAAALYCLNSFSVNYHEARHIENMRCYDRTWICETCGEEW